MIAADFDTESHRAYATGYYNSREAMVWYWDQYVPDPDDRVHPYASPAQADLTGLPRRSSSRRAMTRRAPRASSTRRHWPRPGFPPCTGAIRAPFTDS